MGASKDGGYAQKSVVTPDQETYLNQLLQQASQNQSGAQAGYSQFLPQSAGGQVGGKGGQAFIDQALQSYRQNFVPEALNAFGANSGAKSSSALNNSLAQGASDAQTKLSSLLSELQLQGAQGLAGLGSQQGQVGSQTPRFAFLQKQQPLWQSLLLGGVGAAGQVGGGYLGGRS